jgi:O-antigen ligase/tetratricopeptide (TPR) repeat protein
MAKNKKITQTHKSIKSQKVKVSSKIDIHCILLLLALIPIAFSGIFQGGFVQWETYATLLLSLPAIFLFVYMKFVRGEPVRSSGADSGILLFFAVAFLSLFFTVYFHATLTELYKVLLYVALFYIVLNSTNSDKLLNFAINAILALSAVLSLGGILAFVGYKLNLQSAFFKFLLNRGLLQGEAVSSTLQYSNAFGAFLILPFFVSVGYLLSTRSVLRKIIYFALSLLFLVTFALTQSRGAIIAFALSLIAFVLLLKGKERKASIFSFVALIIVFGAVAIIKKDVVFPMFNLLIDKFKLAFSFLKGTTDQSIGARLYMIEDSLKILKARPIFGTGNGTYQYVYTIYRSIYFFSKFPHSILFQVLDETGIIGGIVLLYMIISMFFRGFSVLRKNYSPVIVGLFSGVLGFTLHAFIDFDWSLMFMPLLFFFVFALILSQGKESLFAFKRPIGESFKKKGVSKELKTKNQSTTYGKRLSLTLILFVILFLLFLFPFISSNADRIATAKIGKVPLTETVAAYQSAIALDTLDTAPHYDLANFYTSDIMPNVQDPSQYVSDAINQYNAAIQRCPEFFLYHYELGKLYLQTDDSKAIDEFATGVALNPLDPGGHASLALAYLNIKKNTDMAKIQLDEALNLGQEEIAQGYATQDVLTDTYIGFGAFYEQLNVPDKALENYNLAIKSNYQNAYAYYRSGLIYEQKGMLPEAVQSLFFAVLYDPALKDAQTEFEKYAPIITLASPQNGMMFKPGDTVKIQWLPSNFKNTESYVIYLIPPQGDQILLVSNIDPKTFSYDWKASSSLSYGKYTLRIYAAAPKFMQGKLGSWISYTDTTIFIQK